MNRSYSNKFKAPLITIFPGEIYISSSEEIISTVLGSCIAVCLYDLENNIGGMNHFMLPKSNKHNSHISTKNHLLDMDELTDNAMRFGITAMDVLLAKMVKKGAQRKNIRAKIFGGGNVLTSMTIRPTVGERNIEFAKSYLKTEGITLENEHIAENIGRKIFFLTGSSSVFVKAIPINKANENDKIYREKLSVKKIKTDITIF